MMYSNRHDAGKKLADELRRFEDQDAVVMALTRGGVVLGSEIAKELHIPLGLVFVKKIGHPSHPEYAIGVIAEDEPLVYDKNHIAEIDKDWLANAEQEARLAIDERRKAYLGTTFSQPEIEDKDVIIVDDGIATGLSMEAAAMYVMGRNPKNVIIAAPVASIESVAALSVLADEVLVLDDPASFSGAVGSHYQEFEQVDDNEVKEALEESRM